MPKRKTNLIALAAITALTIAACSHHKAGGDVVVHFDRFEQLLFDTPIAQLPDALAADQQRFDTPLLNIAPNSPRFMAQLTEFVSDPTVRGIYRTTDSLYHDLTDVENAIQGGLSKAQNLIPTLDYRKFYTLITADFQDYRNRIFCDDNALAISIDKYALPHLEHYQYFGVPRYIVNLCTKEYIVADCMAAIGRANIELPEGDLTLLDYMIAEGKAMHFAAQTLPSTPDTIIARYTAEQMQWMKQNEKNVWAYLVQNQLLFNTDYSQFHNLIDDAPKTNAFGENSAPRTVAYIGWQIVSRYMKRTRSTMADLFAQTDSQAILQQSNYRP